MSMTAPPAARSLVNQLPSPGTPRRRTYSRSSSYISPSSPRSIFSLGGGDVRLEGTHESDQYRRVALCLRGGDAFGVFHGIGERFLTEDVHAGVERRDGTVGVERVRHRDHDGVQVLRFEHAPVLLVALGDVVGVGERRAHSGADVGDRGERCVERGERVGMPAGDRSAADEPNVEHGRDTERPHLAVRSNRWCNPFVLRGWPRSMLRTAIQLYTLRDLDERLPELLARVGEAGYDGVEFAGLEDDAAEVNDALGEAGLDVAGAHVPIEALTDSFAETVSRYRQVDCETFVVPYLDESHFETRTAAERTARELSALAARLAEEGIALHYHNHDHEFVALDGGTAFDVLVEETEGVRFELDVGWVAAAGHDPEALLDELGDRVSLVHCKDVRIESGEPVELGAGDVDLRGCIEAARCAGVEWLVYEHDRPSDPVASLRHGAERLGEHKRDALDGA
jgi:sugar phosphate isomerase/epimerase